MPKYLLYPLLFADTVLVQLLSPQVVLSCARLLVAAPTRRMKQMSVGMVPIPKPTVLLLVRRSELLAPVSSAVSRVGALGFAGAAVSMTISRAWVVTVLPASSAALKVKE